MTMARKHSEITQEVLCAEYEAVYRYVLSLSRSESLSQDITQETFLRAMKSTASFRGDCSLYTWLCTIAKNLWRTHCAKEGREVPADELEERPSPDTPCEEQVIQKDSALELHRLLHALPEPYKEVFSLRVFGQLSYREIAGLFEKTESWARVTYYRAKKMIQEQLPKEDRHE